MFFQRVSRSFPYVFSALFSVFAFSVLCSFDRPVLCVRRTPRNGRTLDVGAVCAACVVVCSFRRVSLHSHASIGPPHSVFHRLSQWKALCGGNTAPNSVPMEKWAVLPSHVSLLLVPFCLQWIKLLLRRFISL